MKDNHYFASFVFGWKVAKTRDEAIKGLVDGFRTDVKPIVKNAHKRGERGAYIWSCKVNAPITDNYKIEWFAPKGIDISEAKEHYVTYLTNKEIAYYTETDD